MNHNNRLHVTTEHGTPVTQVSKPNGIWIEIGDWCRLWDVRGMEQLVVEPPKVEPVGDDDRTPTPVTR